MPNPNVYEVGRVTDIDERPLPVGVDYDCVVIGDYRLPLETAQQFAVLFVAACWKAGGRAAAD